MALLAAGMGCGFDLTALAPPGGGGLGRIRVRGTTSRTINAAATVSPAAAS